MTAPSPTNSSQQESIALRLGVLQVTIGPYPEVRGGIDMLVKTLVERHRDEDCRITVFVPGSWEQRRLRRETTRDGIPIYTRRLRMPYGPSKPLRHLLGWLLEAPFVIRALLKVCREQRIDVIHVHSAPAYLAYFRVLLLFGGPVYIVTFHGGEVVNYRRRRWIERQLIRWGLQGAKFTTAVSKWLAQEAKHTFPSLALPPNIIYNGLCMDSIRHELSTSSVLSAPGRYFLIVAALYPYKGQDVAIEAWPRIVRHDPSLKLLIAGEGPYRPDYERLIKQQECDDSIYLIGQRPHCEILSLMAGAIALIVPSRNEGFGYVVLEASAVGTPVICSDIAPLNEIVEDGKSGLLFGLESTLELCTAAISLAKDPGRRSELASSLRRRTIDDFGLAEMARRYKQLYADAVANNS